MSASQTFTSKANESLQFYQSSSNSFPSSSKNNYNNTYYFAYDEKKTQTPTEDAQQTTEAEEQHAVRLKKKKKTSSQSDSFILYNTALPTEDTLLLEKSTPMGGVNRTLHKSNSYSGSLIKAKSTILKQDSLNGRIAISLTTDNEADYGTSVQHTANNSSAAANANGNDDDDDDGGDEHDAFLIDDGANNSSANNNTSPRRSSSKRSHGKSHTSICYRAHAFINRNWYLSYLVPLSILLALMFVAYITRDYAKRLLFWIETQNPWIIFGLFMMLFIVVSFPIVVGYFVLMITAGYLFGFLKGFLTVILGANVGIAIAHITIRSFRHRIPMHRLIKNETGRAILRVISGPRAFKVVLFTRLTPIPFGIQNAIFGVSSVNSRVYHSGSILGLLPAQIINVYLGSTLRSMHEVLNNHGTAVTGYITFAVEVVCGVALMFWVVQKARKELSETLISDLSSDGKLIDIQV